MSLSAPPDYNILTHLLTTTPKPHHLPPQTLLQISRLAAGFDRMLIPPQAPILLISPPTPNNQIIYLATVASGRIFTSLPHSSAVQTISQTLQSLKPALILADPNTSLGKVLDAVEVSGTGLRDRVFSFEEEDWSDPKNGILDWKILMARAVDGRAWIAEVMGEERARKCVAVIGEDGVARSHWEVVQRAGEVVKERQGVSLWEAVLPWNQGRSQVKGKL